MNYYQIGKDFELKESGDFKKKEKTITKPLQFLMVDVGLYIIFPLLLAVYLGLYIDKSLGTRNLFTLVLIFFAFLCTIYNLIRLTKHKGL